MGLFGMIKSLYIPEYQSASNIASVVPESIDVFGGDEFGDRAKNAIAKNPQHVGDYLQNAVKNFAQNKVGKRIAGKLDAGADLANAFGEDNKTEAGSKIQDVADWFAGSDRKKREDARRKSGLYAY